MRTPRPLPSRLQGGSGRAVLECAPQPVPVPLGADLALAWEWVEGVPVFVVLWQGRRESFFGYRGGGSDWPS